jgi:hypothetical protein
MRQPLCYSTGESAVRSFAELILSPSVLVIGRVTCIAVKERFLEKKYECLEKNYE